MIGSRNTPVLLALIFVTMGGAQAAETKPFAIVSMTLHDEARSAGWGSRIRSG